ncbi:MAG: sporulation integral membrane protein YtvI [Desulfotomaculaceae bacterium]|nr:sporulation integral membrane protein YtvI [Desulfotomaculaceae bacterium]MDD4766013.1 sporulation integral membrane protein YtvI [Desulfotomaculaceae bacterium]
MPRPLLLIVYTAVAILAGIAFIKYALPILVPFIIAIIIGMFMDPLISILQRAKMSRGLATLTTMVLVFGGIGAIISLLIIRLVTELVQLSASLPGLTVEIKSYLQVLIEKMTAFYVTLPPGVTSSIEQSLNNLASSLQGMATGVANTLLSFISMVPGTFVVLLVILLSSYFIARDKQIIINFIIHLAPDAWGEKIINTARDVGVAFIGYIKAQAILIFVSTCISVTGLYLIGADYALLVGLIIGVFDLIPVLGPATIYLPWIVWSFATGSTGFGVKLAILYLVVLVTRQILETKIVSGNLGLHPLATLISMYAGLWTLGLPGLILGPIILIAIQSFYKAGILLPKSK